MKRHWPRLLGEVVNDFSLTAPLSLSRSIIPSSSSPLGPVMRLSISLLDGRRERTKVNVKEEIRRHARKQTRTCLIKHARKTDMREPIHRRESSKGEAEEQKREQWKEDLRSCDFVPRSLRGQTLPRVGGEHTVSKFRRAASLKTLVKDSKRCNTAADCEMVKQVN